MLVGFLNYTLLAGASAVVNNIIIGTTTFLSKQRNIITAAIIYTLYYIISYTILYSHIDYRWFEAAKHSYFKQILKKLCG